MHQSKFHWALLKFLQNYIKIFVLMKALKTLKSIVININEGKTIQAVQLLELSLGWWNGKTRSTC